MLDVGLCPECKVPEPFNQGQVWLNNGDIVQRANAGVRIGFIECENLDPLYANIGDIIGMPIEPMVISTAARGTKVYLSGLIPKEVKEMVRAKKMALTPFIDSIITYCHIVGYGKYEFLDYRYENDADDYSRQRAIEPFSVPEAAGAYAGAVSAILGGEVAVSYEEVSPGEYIFTTHWTEYPEVLKERLQLHDYQHKDGDIELERCGTCDCPKAFSGYRWYLDKGIIVNKHTGRRMALLGPELLDRVFDALEEELGETIPDVVVEAQRRFVQSGFYSITEVSNEGDFRTQLALRGLGNLREIKMGANGLRMRIDNAAGYLMIVGLAQGLFEMALDVKSNVEWELSEEGDLEVEVKPQTVMETVKF